MTVSSWQFQPDKTQNWAYMNNLFTPEECAQIIDIGNTKLIEATVAGENNGVRESQIAWRKS